MPRPIPDPTIMTNFLTMAETTVCKATLSSWSGSEALLALLVSTSPEHREMACRTRVPVGSPRKSAAIIPFVNESLTSGLPIASTPEFVNNFNSCRSVNDRGGGLC